MKTFTGSSPASRNRRLTVLALAALAIIVRLAYVLTLERRIYWYDGTEYSRLALGLLEHRRYLNEAMRTSAFWPPGYPLFLAAVYWFLGPSVMAIRVAQCALGGLTVAMIFAIARRFLNPPGSYLAAGAMALYPLYIYSAGAVLPITLQTTLIAGTFLLCLRAAETGSIASALGAGLLAGWAALTAPSALPALLLFVPWLVWSRRKNVRPGAFGRGHGRRREVLTPALCFLFSLILLPGGWIARNHHALGGFTPISTNGGYNLWLGNYPGVTASTGNRPAFKDMESEEERIWLEHDDERDRDIAYFRAARHYISADQRHFIELTLSKVVYLWNLYPQPMTTDRPRLSFEHLASILSYGLLLPLALAWLLVRVRRDSASVMVLGLFLAFSLVHGVFLSKVRFRLPLDSFVIIYGTGGYLALLGTLRRAASVFRTRPSLSR